MSQHTISITKEVLFAIMGYTVLAVSLTWPVAVNLSSMIGGFDGRDSFQHVWLYWWFWEALLNQQQTPATVTALYFPLGAFHPVLWIHALAPLFGLPLTGLAGSTVTYNVTILLAIILSGLTAYLLCRAVVGHPQAAFLGGLIFTSAPTRLGHITAGHQLLVFSFALPLYALASWLWLRRPSWQRAGLYAVTLFLVLISHPNFVGYFLLPVTLVLFIAHWWQHGRFSRKQWRHLLLGWLVAVLLFLPFAWPLITELFGQNLAFLRPKDPGEHSADLLSYVTPSPYHPFWQGQPPALLTSVLDRERALEEGFNYVGLVALLLAGLGLWRRWRQTRLWLALAGLTAVLALGPTLIVAGQDTGWSLPYYLLVELPFFSWSRTPGRLNMTATLGLSVVAAAGAAHLFGKSSRSLTINLLTAGMVVLIVLEYLPLWPFPVDTRSTPVYYHQLMKENIDGGILEIPVTGSRRASNYAMFYQTTHRQPLAGGYIERDPPGTVELKEFLNQLVSPIPPQNVLAVPNAAQRRAILANLRIARAIAHPDLMTDRAARERLAYLPALLGEAITATETLRIFPINGHLDDLSNRIYLLPDQENWEVIREGAAFRLKKNGFLFLYAPDIGCVTLNFQFERPGEAATLALQIDDVLDTTYTMDTADSVMVEALPLRKGLNTIQLSTNPERDIDFLKIEASLFNSGPACTMVGE